jgi:chromosome partitioning protein
MGEKKQAKVITFGIQKGGAGKTSSAAITAYLMSANYKVLAVDCDAQGNLTEIFTLKPIREYRGEDVGGVLDAIKERDPKPYILALSENLHLLPGDELMNTLTDWMYEKYKNNRVTIIREMLETIRDHYDYIIIDTPPALGPILTDCLIASDAVIAMFETGQFCYSALLSFQETVEFIQNGRPEEGIAPPNPGLVNMGILCTMLDARRSDNKDFLLMVQERFSSLVFGTIIKRQAATGRIAFGGFIDNPEIETAVSQYRPFVEEVLARVRS